MDNNGTFEELVRQHEAMVFRTLLRLTGSREHLEDLAQDVFLRLYRALPGFRGEALVSTYLTALRSMSLRMNGNAGGGMTSP